jgi:hypothetical protein
VTVRSLPRPKAKGNAEFSLFAGCNAELSVAQYRECGRKGRKKNTRRQAPIAMKTLPRATDPIGYAICQFTPV